MTRYIRTGAQPQFAQNIAAISGDFHTHCQYSVFHEIFGKMIDGFSGHYEICVRMAEALTNWETANGTAMLMKTWVRHGLKLSKNTSTQ
jgi:hypothetical protein